MKVLFVTGWGRSGSTILDRLLGLMPAAFSAGEVRYVWDRGLLENRLCGCSIPFRECPVWSRALADFLALGREELTRLVELRDRLRVRHVWGRRSVAAGRRAPSAAVERYAEQLAQVYAGLERVTGSRIVVDSSKFPSHGYVLGLLPVDLYIVHLIRDPRAVAYSWGRKKVYEQGPEGPRYIPPHGPLRSSYYWLSWNLTAEYLWAAGAARARYYRLRYEDFVRRPAERLAEIAGMMGEPAPELPRGGAPVELRESHLVAGNPVRFQTGAVEVRPDEEWRRSMPAAQRLLVTASTWPLLLRYGYGRRGS